MTVLENSVQVLRCFAQGRADLTVTDAAQLLSLPKSNVSRLLRSMRDVGLLDDAPESRGYRLGAFLLELGQTLRAGQSIVALADNAVRRICEQIGHTGYVSVLKGREMIGLSHHVGSNPLQVGVPLGRRLPVDACSTGRALLARMDNEQVRTLLGGQLSLANAHAPSSFDDLFDRLRKVRERGYAESFEEAGRGIAAVSVAVASKHTGEAVSLCIAHPIATVEEAERKQVIDLLLRAKTDLTRYLS